MGKDVEVMLKPAKDIERVNIEIDLAKISTKRLSDYTTEELVNELSARESDKNEEQSSTTKDRYYTLNKESNFTPTRAIAPGESIKEHIEYIGKTRQELAISLGLTEEDTQSLIGGALPITWEIAKRLEAEIGPSAQSWMNLEANYRATLKRLGE